VDAVTGDRGQALVLAVLALALAAVTIVGLRAAQDRVLADAHQRRAGEAAIEAAGATLADAQVAFVSGLRDEMGGRRVAPTRAELDQLISDPLVVERARGAAEELSARNAGPAIEDLRITVSGRSLEISLLAGAHRPRVAIGTRCCRP
jgi:hypothetical protein